MIIPVGYSQVTHFFTGNSLPRGAAITFGVGGFGSPTPEDAAAAFHALFQDNVLPLLTSTVSLETTRVKQGPNSTGNFGQYTEILAGGNDPLAASPQVAFLVEKRTATGGRSGRGRMYVPGVPEADVNGDGSVRVLQVPVIQAALDAWLADVQLEAVNMFLFHNASSDPTIVTSLQLDPVVATQRRRLR